MGLGVHGLVCLGHVLGWRSVGHGVIGSEVWMPVVRDDGVMGFPWCGSGLAVHGLGCSLSGPSMGWP
jgi:hypothetical protein